LVVATAKGQQGIPLDKVRPATFKGCALCPDLSAEMADISVGAAEGSPGLNTIIVRTPAGAELLELAQAKGLVELAPVPAESWEHLSTAAANKRARARAAWPERHHA
jgi:coenzyme F420 hydrogenase subunit beta